MADTVLVVADLAPDLIEAGRTLLMKLDAKAVHFDAAFWLMDPKNGNWRLHLGVTAPPESGLGVFYERVDAVLSDMGLGSRFWIGIVTILRMESKIMQSLTSALGNAASVDGARLDNAVIGGMRFPACLLYRLSSKQQVGPGANNPAPSPRRRKSPKTAHSAAA